MFRCRNERYGLADQTALELCKRRQNAQINQFTPLYPAVILAGEIRILVSVSIQNALICVARPTHTIVPKQVELVVDDAPDFGINVTQVAQAHLV